MSLLTLPSAAEADTTQGTLGILQLSFPLLKPNASSTHFLILITKASTEIQSYQVGSCNVLHSDASSFSFPNFCLILCKFYSLENMIHNALGREAGAYMQIQQEASSNKQCAISASPKRSYCVFLNSIDSLSCSGHTEMHYVPGLKEAAEKQNASCFTMKQTE